MVGNFNKEERDTQVRCHFCSQTYNWLGPSLSPRLKAWLGPKKKTKIELHITMKHELS
jgi:hypothetical protein